MWAYELQKAALEGLVDRTGIPKSEVGYVCTGTVIQECKTSNIGREALLCAAFPRTVPAHTVTMACISSNQAITACMGFMNSGMTDVTIAGGVETLSDVPIRYNRKARAAMFQLNKAKSVGAKLSLAGPILKNLFNPELPAIA
jgi:acetyl-CoA acyltransferase